MFYVYDVLLVISTRWSVVFSISVRVFWVLAVVFWAELCIIIV